MTQKKEKKEKKEKKDIINIRNIKERQNEITPIIENLTRLQLTIIYDPIKNLMKILQKFIQEGGTYQINILFSEINKRIIGFLTDNKKHDIWIKLQQI